MKNKHWSIHQFPFIFYCTFCPSIFLLKINALGYARSLKQEERKYIICLYTFQSMFDCMQVGYFI
uniref:Uncharacterized protein n=1 Tax=Anguilla anguilla TaxID=7936 RepID=A0A0E9X324_ANGAN